MLQCIRHSTCWLAFGTALLFSQIGLSHGSPVSSSNGTSSWNPTNVGRRAIANACSIIAESLRHDLRYRPTVGLAESCLQQIPFDVLMARQTVENLHKFLDLHTNTKIYLDDRIGTVSRPAVQLRRDLSIIYSRITGAAYESEYDFEKEVFSLFTRCRDAHLIWQGPIMGSLFNFTRDSRVALVSIDLNGKGPEIYLRDDIQRGSPRVVTTIDNKPAGQWLQATADATLNIQDADARWNAMFANNFAYAGNVLEHGVFVHPAVKPDLATTTIGFAGNEPPLIVPNIVEVVEPENWVDVRVALDLYDVFALQKPITRWTLRPRAIVVNDTEAPRGGPKTSRRSTPQEVAQKQKRYIGSPVDMELGNDGGLIGTMVTIDPSMGGTQPLARDVPVAVLRISTFEQNNAMMSLALFEAFSYFIKNNAQKIVLDLRNNLGGHYNDALRVFRFFFPSEEMDISYQLRAGLPTYLLAGVIGQVSEAYLPDGVDIPWNFRIWSDSHGTPLTSWRSMGAPTFRNNDHYTNYIRHRPVSDSDLLLRLPFTTPPFPNTATDMVIVTNGLCGSACALLVAALRRRGALIKTIVVGGQHSPPDPAQPRRTAPPMALLGDTRGGTSVSLSDLATLMRDVISPASRILPNAYEYARNLPQTEGPIYAHHSSVNVVDVFYGNGVGMSTLPLQFTFEPADCRLDMGLHMWLSDTVFWSTIARVAFGGADPRTRGLDLGACVPVS